jgi:hypothetical protein
VFFNTPTQEYGGIAHEVSWSTRDQSVANQIQKFRIRLMMLIFAGFGLVGYMVNLKPLQRHQRCSSTPPFQETTPIKIDIALV